MFNSVDLPDPDLPYKIAISPRLILKDIPFKTSVATLPDK